MRKIFKFQRQNEENFLKELLSEFIFKPSSETFGLCQLAERSRNGGMKSDAKVHSWVEFRSLNYLQRFTKRKVFSEEIENSDKIKTVIR